MTRRLVVVPMKDPQSSKTRLKSALTTKRRESLARVLYRRTLEVLCSVQAVGQFDLAVVTTNPEVVATAQSFGAAAIAEGARKGLNAALETAARHAERQGYQDLCVFPADLAAPDPEDILRLLQLESPHKVIICPATDLGTNALRLSLPAPIPFCFGSSSAVRHREAAGTRGISACLLPLESLKFDIDTEAHLSLAQSRTPELCVL